MGDGQTEARIRELERRVEEYRQKQAALQQQLSQGKTTGADAIETLGLDTPIGRRQAMALAMLGGGAGLGILAGASKSARADAVAADVGTQADPWQKGWFHNIGAGDGATEVNFDDPISTNKLANTFWALGYDGATGDVKLQAAIDDAAAVDGAAAVIVTGEPDDLSGYAEATRNSGWLISSTVQHPSDVYIYNPGDAYWMLDDSVDAPIIENADHSGGNSNLKLVGGTFNCNNAANDTQSNPPENGNLLYYPVDDIEISPRKVTNYGPSVFAVQVGNGSNWQFGDIEFDGDKDGLKLHGPASDFRIDRLTGDAGDAMLSLAAADYSSLEISTGVIENGVIEQVGEPSTTFDSGGVDFVGNSSTVIRDVTIERVYAGSLSRGVLFRNDGQVTGDGKVATENVTIGDFYWEGPGGSGNGLTVGGSTHDNLTIKNFQVKGVDADRLLNLQSDTITELTVDNIQVDDGSNLSQIVYVFSGTVELLKINGGSIWNNAADLLNINSVCNSLIVSNLSLIGPGSAGGTGVSGRALLSNGSSLVDAKFVNCEFKHCTDATRAFSGSTDTFKFANCTFTNCNRLANVDGTLELMLSNVEADSFGVNVFRLSDGATIDVKAENFKSDESGDMFDQATATNTIQVDGRDIQVDVGEVSPRKYDRAFNTDSGETVGVGEAIYQGSAWKNMDAI